MSNRFRNFLKTLGPGILFASTAIGVSHLVQSTRAGAAFGFALIPIILAVNLFKYPFFEYGSRYANATGESIIDGYKRIGKWMLWLYFLITLGSMFFVCAAVGAVTSGFLQNLFGVTDWGIWFTIALFLISGTILFLGKYGFLDSLIKIIGSVLLVSTLFAFVLALSKGPNPGFEGFEGPNIWENSSMVFIIALMGWMPTAVDLSAWTSLWTIERIKQTGYRPSLKETLMDFNFGYLVSSLLAICFVTLGAYMLFGSGQELPDGSGAFAHSIIGLFTGFIGEWSYIIIAIAAFSIMFGTCIAVFDGYSRSIERTVDLLFIQEDLPDVAKADASTLDSDIVETSLDNNTKKVLPTTNIYKIALSIVIIGAFGIVYFFGKHLKTLVDLATTISFLIAPVIAIVNFRLVTGRYIGKEAHPKMWLKVLSILGIIFITGFACYFVWIKFIVTE